MYLNYAGIDLAGSIRRPTGVCIMDERLRVHCFVTHSDDEILELVKRAGSRVVAIDAPLALPIGRHCLEEHCRGREHFRACDLALRRMGIRFFPITLGPMRALTRRGMDLRKKLENRSVEVIETYPGASQDLLGIERKQHGLKRLQNSLRKLGCSGDIDLRQLTGDELDAISCALVAKDYSEGNFLAIGNPSEIMMILPKK
jgi:predicted nuclease with RNAse H fold